MYTLQVKNPLQPNMVTSATSSTVTSVSHVTSEVSKDEATGATKTTMTQHDQTQVVVSSTSEQVRGRGGKILVYNQQQNYACCAYVDHWTNRVRFTCFSDLSEGELFELS